MVTSLDLAQLLVAACAGALPTMIIWLWWQPRTARKKEMKKLVGSMLARKPDVENEEWLETFATIISEFRSKPVRTAWHKLFAQLDNNSDIILPSRNSGNTVTLQISPHAIWDSRWELIEAMAKEAKVEIPEKSADPVQLGLPFTISVPPNPAHSGEKGNNITDKG